MTRLLLSLALLATTSACSQVRELNLGPAMGVSRQAPALGGEASIRYGAGWASEHGTTAIGAEASLHGRLLTDASGVGAGTGLYLATPCGPLVCLPRAGVQGYLETSRDPQDGIGPAAGFALAFPWRDESSTQTNILGDTELHRTRNFVTVSVNAYANFRTQVDAPIVFIGLAVGGADIRTVTFPRDAPKPPPPPTPSPP